MADPTRNEIEQRAYALWHRAGRPEGREEEFWYEAERELQNSDTTDHSSERSDTFTEPVSCDAMGCGPLVDSLLAAAALIAINGMLLSLGFARYLHRAFA
jgi:hypothetical protein